MRFLTILLLGLALGGPAFATSMRLSTCVRRALSHVKAMGRLGNLYVLDNPQVHPKYILWELNRLDKRGRLVVFESSQIRVWARQDGIELLQREFRSATFSGAVTVRSANDQMSLEEWHIREIPSESLDSVQRRVLLALTSVRDDGALGGLMSEIDAHSALFRKSLARELKRCKHHAAPFIVINIINREINREHCDGETIAFGIESLDYAIGAQLLSPSKNALTQIKALHTKITFRDVPGGRNALYHLSHWIREFREKRDRRNELTDCPGEVSAEEFAEPTNVSSEAQE